MRKPKRVESAEGADKTEDAGNAGNAERTETAKISENVERVESAEGADKTENAERVEKRKNNGKSSKKRESAHSPISNNLYFFKLLFRLSPLRLILATIDMSKDYFVWLFSSIIFTRFLFSAYENSYTFSMLIPMLILTASIVCISWLFDFFFEDYYIPASNEKINAKFMKILYGKTTSVELACFEDNDFFNKYTMALAQVNDKFQRIAQNVISVFVSLISALYVYYTFFTIDPYLVLFSLAPILGTFLIGKRMSKYAHERSLALNPFHRKRDYVSRIIYLNGYAKEMRLSNIYNVLDAQFNDAYGHIVKETKRFAPKTSFFSFLENTLDYIIPLSGIFLYATYMALSAKSMSFSQFGVVVGAFSASSHTLIRFGKSIKEVYENGYFIDNVRIFMDYSPKIDENADGLTPEKNIESIEFRNVTFSYPNTDIVILQNLNLKVNGREKLVVVGLNGAGKTTFTKLLMRFYDPDEGEILLNGRNIKEYNLKKYRALFRAAFQDYKLYAMSVAENVVMKSRVEPNDKTLALTALVASGAEESINALPKKHENMVTKEFSEDGAVFSGGQGQKLAISRAFFDEGSICVLDEPSSALDAVAENTLYDSMCRASENKMVFFISHRLSAAVYADKILLIDGKEFKEYGTHSELMALKGLYYNMFSMQAERYNDDGDEASWDKVLAGNKKV